MRHLISLAEWSRDDLGELLGAADRYARGAGRRRDGTAVLFFPPTSLRTRVSFESGAAGMGLQPIVFPPEALDGAEDLADVAAYLACWADLLVVRHTDPTVLERLAAADALPVINAMTSVDHPCEVLADLYALTQASDPLELRYLFVGADGNIARAWRNAAQAFDLDLRQCCPPELRTPGMTWTGGIAAAMSTADVILTDGPGVHAEALAPYRVTAELLDRAPAGARFAPCPPFIRGREVSADAIRHPAFAGHRFKQALKPVQQAVMARALGDRG